MNDVVTLAACFGLAALFVTAFSKPGKTLVAGIFQRDRKGRITLVLTPTPKPKRRRKRRRSK